MLLTAILNLIFSIVFGNLIGLAGILFATSLSRVLTYFWYEPILLFNKFFGHSSKEYFVSILKSALILVIVSFCANIVSNYIQVDNFVTLVIKASILLILSSLISILFYRTSGGYKFLKQKFMNKIL